MDSQSADVWYYIIVQNPGTPDEKIMGYLGKKTDQQFIPAFKTKEIAQQCFLIMPKNIIKEKYEVQAIIFEDLMAQAEKNDYKVFLLDEKGSYLDELSI